MCSRFALKSPPAAIASLFKAEKVFEWRPRYNLAPSQKIPVAVHSPEKKTREIKLLRWGFQASWTQAKRLIVNLRSEELDEKPDLREIFKQGRCLIPVDGFYEWKHAARETRPYYFHLKKEGPFALAGLWTIGKGSGDKSGACAILTTGPNEVVRAVHDRMPVVVREEDYGKWLDGELRDPQEIEKILRPISAAGMSCHQVGPWVNDANHDDPRCLEPFQGPETLELPF